MHKYRKLQSQLSQEMINQISRKVSAQKISCSFFLNIFWRHIFFPFHVRFSKLVFFCHFPSPKFLGHMFVKAWEDQSSKLCEEKVASICVLSGSFPLSVFETFFLHFFVFWALGGALGNLYRLNPVLLQLLLKLAYHIL